MRRTRWVVLAVMIAIVCGIGARYRARKIALREQDRALVKPAPLPLNLNSSMEAYHLAETFTKDGVSRTKAEIFADDFKEQKDTGRVDLRGVRLNIPSKKGDTYNVVKSAEASFYKGEHRLYSDGDVEITLNIPLDGKPKRQPVIIKSSGINYDTSGRAETDRPSSFSFERGEGTATGASYDPATHRLLMKSEVKVDWKPAGPHAKPMKIEGGSLEYVEADSQIWLRPWGRLTRENSVVEGEVVVIHLQDTGEGQKEIRQIEATKAHGTDEYPGRKLQYSADRLLVDFDDNGQANKITAQDNARLVSTSDATETTVTANHVELNFAAQDHRSLLTQVTSSGNSEVTAKPIAAPGRQPGETHILRSETLDMKMRDGGREIATILTHAPGTLEFVPNLPVQHHRTLDAKDMAIVYGSQNRIESFGANGVRTVTDPSADELKRDAELKRPARKAAVTSSRDMLANFDPKSSRMLSMEQWGDFVYESGDRQARAAKASLDENQHLIVLETAARMWDPTGSTAADRIRLDEVTGDFNAEGNVTSSRLPDRDQKKNSETLSGDQPLQAQARKMQSAKRNRALRYEGDVTMWQGANKIQASTIDIDREKRVLVADGNVVTHLWEQPKEEKAPAKKKAGAPVLTVVHASHLVYTEADRQAVYSGGVVLNRPGLDVKARELRAFLADSGADSRLEKAFAEGSVQIVQTSRAGTRTGTGDHGEYYTDEQKVALKGAQAKLVERKSTGKQDTTTGEELTYFADDDRLLVNGSPARPGQSRIQRK